MSLVKYFSHVVEFVQFKEKIKCVPCPFCHKTGFLILHGKLPGRCVLPDGTEKDRGHRYFCSNKNKKQGCGHTFSILWKYVLKYRSESAQCFWRFLKNILQGHSLTKPFHKKVLPFSSRTAKRWWDKFKYVQSHLRSHLIKLAPHWPVDSPDPLIQTILHIKHCFPQATCPLEDFQYHLQTAFLSTA